MSKTVLVPAYVMLTVALAAVLYLVFGGAAEAAQPSCPSEGSTLCGTGVSPTMVQVPCPSEDSCTVDYGDGTWTITEVRP